MGSTTGKQKMEAKIRCHDMSEEQISLAVETAAEALENFTTRKDVAEKIKKVFDENYGPNWHCVVGKDFGR